MSETTGTGRYRFEFDDDWFEGTHHKGLTDGWAHHGIAVTPGGDVVTFDERLPKVLILSPDGRLLREFAVDVVEAHGMSVVVEDGKEFVWIADIAAKMRRREDGLYERDSPPLRGDVLKYRLDGTLMQRLGIPPVPAYSDGDYRPSQVAVDDSFAGSGDMWIADG